MFLVALVDAVVLLPNSDGNPFAGLGEAVNLSGDFCEVVYLIE